MATIRYYRDTGSVLNKSHAYDCVWKKIKIRSSVQSACEPGPVGILIRYPAQIWGVSRRRLRDLPNAYRFREAPGYHPGYHSTSGEDLPGVRGNDRTPEILIMRTESANRSGWEGPRAINLVITAQRPPEVASAEQEQVPAEPKRDRDIAGECARTDALSRNYRN